MILALLAALSFIGDCESATTTCTLPTRAANDLIVTCAYKASVTAPSAPTGYTAITGASASASVSSQNCACRIATNNSSDNVTWTSTAGVGVAIYRGQADTATCTNNFGTPVPGTGAATTLTYSAITMSVTDGTSWIYGFGGQTTATNLSTNGTPAGKTQRAATGAIATYVQWDTNGGVSSDGSVTATITSANRWRSTQLEIKAACSGVCFAFKSTTNTSGTSMSTTVTTSGASMILIAPMFAADNNTTTFSAVTVGGNAATQIATVAANPSTWHGADIWCYWSSAALAAVTVSVTASASDFLGLQVVEATGTDANSCTGAKNTGSGTSATPSISVTVNATSSKVFGAMANFNTGATAGTNTALIQASTDGNGGGYYTGNNTQSETAGGAYSAAFAVTSGAYAIAGIEICAAGATCGGGGGGGTTAMQGTQKTKTGAGR